MLFAPLLGVALSWEARDLVTDNVVKITRSSCCGVIDDPPFVLVRPGGRMRWLPTTSSEE